MKGFSELYLSLDASNRKNEKLSVLRNYFSVVPPEDGAWAVFFLTGNRLKRPIRMTDFRKWAGLACGQPAWLVDECYNHVGDLAETLALLLSEHKRSIKTQDRPLHQLVQEDIIPLRDLGVEEQRERLESIWEHLDGSTCFIFNKLITGGFRVGVSQSLVAAALAELANVEPAIMAHRLMGIWKPTPCAYKALFTGAHSEDQSAKPYPFCLSYPLDEIARSRLDAISNWQVEWKWDGIRAQLIKRENEVILWSRGEEMLTDQFPEIVEEAASWSGSIVLDGELLAWDHDSPAPFSELQRRLGRKNVSVKMRNDVPVLFMSYDLLEFDGVDFRNKSTQERRSILQSWSSRISSKYFGISPLIDACSWEVVLRLREESRRRRVEGIMLKRKEAPYHSGRKKGDWWKWKVAPYTIDAIMIYAQLGHGRRAGLYTDYTFAVWNEDSLVPIAKAYSGLSDLDTRKVDRWIRQNTTDSHGPVRVLEPKQVFEIAFEGINESKRHKSGIAVRFPRIIRWRKDKLPKDADSLKMVRSLLAVDS